MAVPVVVQCMMVGWWGLVFCRVIVKLVGVPFDGCVGSGMVGVFVVIVALGVSVGGLVAVGFVLVMVRVAFWLFLRVMVIVSSGSGWVSGCMVRFMVAVCCPGGITVRFCGVLMV